MPLFGVSEFNLLEPKPLKELHLANVNISNNSKITFKTVNKINDVDILNNNIIKLKYNKNNNIFSVKSIVVEV